MTKKTDRWFFTIIWIFDDLKDYVDIFYEMTQDGLTVEKGKLANVVASPHSDAEVELKLQVPNTGKIYLKLIYRLKKEMPLLEQGYELGFDERSLQMRMIETDRL